MEAKIASMATDTRGKLMVKVTEQAKAKEDNTTLSKPFRIKLTTFKAKATEGNHKFDSPGVRTESVQRTN